MRTTTTVRTTSPGAEPRPALPSRRSAIAIAGGSALIAHWLRGAEARAQGAGKARRLVIVHRPNGSIAEDWLAKDGTPGPILQPFAPVWPYAVALKGVDVRPSNGTTGGSHEAGLVTLMTGGRLGATYRTNDDYRSTAESLDQTLAKGSMILGGGRVRSVQLGAHGSQDGGNEIPNVTLSYAGPAMPLYPALNPDDVYKRLFGDLVMPGGASNADALRKARLRRQSVLDFVKRDLDRSRKQFPASAKTDLDAHEGALRELEKGLDVAAAGDPATGCAKPTITAGLRGGGDFRNMERVADAMFKLITAALACDVTRVVTFQWATGASGVSFAGLGTSNHHATSHANDRKVLSGVDRWFSEKTAPFIQSLVATSDAGGGKLIDNTLVWYVNEVSEGWNHSFNDYPFLLFGGDGVGLRSRGRTLNVGGMGRTSNDVWSALAPIFGASIGALPTKSGGPVPGLFQL
jgi:hypothetical protein